MVIFLVTVGQFLISVPKTAEHMFVFDTPVKVDVIVFLGGDASNKRLKYACQLARDGFSGTIYSSAFRNNSIENTESTILPDSITFYFDSTAKSTISEAVFARDFIKKHQYKSVILVTMPIHSYRSMWVFEKILPKNIVMYSCPVPFDFESSDKVLERRKKRNYGRYGYELVRFFPSYVLLNIVPKKVTEIVF